VSKKRQKGLGVVAIALFEMARAQERHAAAQERVAEGYEVVAAATVREYEQRIMSAEAIKEEAAAKVEELMADVRAALPVKEGSADLLSQYRHATGQLLAAKHTYGMASEARDALEVVFMADPANAGKVFPVKA
jgi:Lon protease-like protein